MKKRLSTIIFGCILAAVAVFFGFWYQVNSSRTLAPERAFHINQGDSVPVIAERLEQAGLIRSQYYFLFYIWEKGLRGRTQAGDYLLSGQLTVPEIATKLTSGDSESLSVTVTFPEGWNSRQMAERLNANHLPGDDFLREVQMPKSAWRQGSQASMPAWRGRFAFFDLPADGSLEGFLFPDTYSFFKDATAEDIIVKMLGNFENRFLSGTWGSGSHDHSLYDTVTLASIVENEVKTSTDRKLVADLFWRRIAGGIALGSDATIGYIDGKNTVQHSIEETRIDSPYNTYTHKGLPPGPIGNPGLESLFATLHPTPNPYLYFLSDPVTGETVYAKTFEEHVSNKQKHGL